MNEPTSPPATTRTCDIQLVTPLVSAELRAFVEGQCKGFQRAMAFEVAMMASNLRSGRYAEPEVMRHVENLCAAIRAEKAAAILDVQLGGGG